MTDLRTHRDWFLHGLPNVGQPSSLPACFEPMGVELEGCGFLRPNERQMLHWYTASIPVVGRDGSTDRTAGWVGTLIHDDDPILVVMPGGIDILDNEADEQRRHHVGLPRRVGGSICGALVHQPQFHRLVLQSGGWVRAEKVAQTPIVPPLSPGMVDDV